MKLSKLVLYSAGAFVAVAAIGALTSPKLAAAIRAAYVEVVVPSQPFYSYVLVSDSRAVPVGPGAGTLGITNITLTNPDSSSHGVNVAQAAGGPAGSCLTASATSISTFHSVIVQPNSTLVIPFPTPWVLGNVQGQTCIGAFLFGGEVASSNPVIVGISGFVN